MGLPTQGWAEINAIYHEQTGRSALEDALSTDCVGPQPYTETRSPAPAQPYVLRFRAEYHGATDQARVYYTIDGSDPAGSLGIGSNTTRVVIADYSCIGNEGGTTVDICTATIPGQAPSTTVKYIVSAWASNDRNELFGNSRGCAGCEGITNASQATLFRYTHSSPPQIASQPQSRTNLAGTQAAFSVTASGLPPLNYQWRFNGSGIPGATNNDYTIASAQTSNAGNYDVVVSNTDGAVTSIVAVLTVRIPPAIRQQPINLTVIQGNSAGFSVFATGDPPLSYQWRLSGTNIPGATLSSYGFGSAQPTDAGNYDVVVSNSFGSVTSAIAVLIVRVPPAITQQPINLTVPQGDSAGFTVFATGDAPLSYQWRFGGTNLSGAILSSYGFGSAQPANAGNYDVIISNPFGSITSAVAVLTVRVPAFIVQQPRSLIVTQGNSATFSIVAGGDAPIGYQWRFKGTNIPGATANSYTVANAQAANAGGYDVIASNSFGSATSTVASLTVRLPPVITQQPASLILTQGNNAAFSVTAIGDAPLSYQWRFRGTNLPGAITSSYSITNAQSANAGNYDVVVSNNSGTATSQVAVLTVRVPAFILQQPVSLTVAQGNSATFNVLAAGDAPLTYQWRFQSTNLAGATSSSYTLGSAQSFNAGNYDVVVSNNSGTVTSLVAVLTVRATPVIIQQPASLIVTQGNNAGFSVTAIGDAPLSYQWRFRGTNLPGAITNSYSITNAQSANAGNYDVVVSNNSGAATSLVASLTVRVPAFILQQPVSLTITQGSLASFNVIAGGDASLSYQWYFNATSLPGATKATLSLATVQAAQAGNYFVVVSNPVGLATSQVAILTVLVAPSITEQPASLTVTQGQSAILRVVAGGDAPLSYRWVFNGVNLEGILGGALTISNAQPANAGNYQVIVTNMVGAITSAVARLTVQAFDFGDAPAGYPTLLSENGARHLFVPGFYLGGRVDFEVDGQPNANATGDDLNGVNDDDGVSFSGPLRLGQTVTASVIASTNGFLQGWIDFNGNSNWADSGEQIFADVPLAPGTNRLSFAVPANASSGPTFARFRFSSLGGLSVVGAAPDGEVEDYAVMLQATADLAVGLSASPNTVLVSNTITCTISVTNNGPSTATGVVVSNPLPARVAFVSAAATAGSCTNAGGVVTCSLGSLGAGSNATVTLILQALGLGLITNSATAFSSEFDVNPADNVASQITACVSPTRFFSSPAPFAIDQVDGGPAVPYPSTIVLSNFTAAVYKITATLSNVNHTFPDDLDILLVGPDGRNVMLMSDAGLDNPLLGVTLTFDDDAPDFLPNSDQVISGTFLPSNYFPDETMPNPVPPGPYGESLSVFKGMNPNGRWSLYVADDTPEDGGSIDNGWSLSITTLDPISDLKLTERHGPEPAAVGTNVAFTLTLTNFGPATANGVRLTDSLPTGLAFVSIATTSGSCTNDSGAISCAWSNLAAGAGARITLVARPVAGGLFTNIFRATSQQSDPNPSDNSAVAISTVTVVTDLALALSSSPARLLAAQNVTYTVLVTNVAGNPATGVTIADLLPAGMTLVSADSSKGSCTNSAGLVTCGLGPLALGDRATVTIVARAGLPGQITNVVTVAGDQFDPALANNSGLAVTTVDPVADLGLTVSSSAQPVGLAQPLFYTMLISNAGPTMASSVRLQNTLAANGTVAEVHPSQGSCSNVGPGSIVCDLGPMASGTNATVVFRVIPSPLGTITNISTLSSPTLDPNSTNNSAVITTTVVPAAEVGISQSASPGVVWIGENQTYTLLISNQGPSQATGVVLTDILPENTTFVSASSTLGSCDNQAGTLTCNFAALPGGGQAVVTVVVRPENLGTINNHATIAANELDPVPANNQTDQLTEVVASAGSFLSSSRIVIPDSGPAIPYPSTITVSSLTAAVEQVRIVLTNLTHTRPDDLDILLVGPNGRGVLLMSDAGGAQSFSNITLRFDDQVQLILPDSGPITSGIYRPTDYEPGDLFPGPAPIPPYGTNFSVFNGINPNGTWSLYVVDDSPGSQGSLEGWSLDIAAGQPLADIAISTIDLPSAVAVGSNVVFNLLITNRGPAIATQVLINNHWPEELAVDSVTSSQGFAGYDGFFLFCELGDLPSGGSATINISAIPTISKTITNLIEVTMVELDPNGTDNILPLVVRVEDPPRIISDPQSLTATNGDSVVLMVAAGGPGPFTYQWQHNGASLAGATNATLTLSNVTPLLGGDYQVQVSNLVAGVLSGPATLFVITPPVISGLVDLTIDEDTASGLIPFTIGDAESPAATLMVTATSLNQALIPDSNIFLGGIASNRTLRLVPLTNQFGTSTISIRVADPVGGVTVKTFLLTVLPVNDPPVILSVADQTTLEDTPALISFTIDDLDTPPNSLTVSAVSSNPGLVTNTNLLLGGSGRNRTLTATPSKDQSGSSLITLTVSDANGGTASTHFNLFVLPVNDPPTLASISNLTIDEDAGPQTLQLTGIGPGASNEIQRLQLTVSSGRPDIIAAPSINYTSPNSTGTLLFAPTTNANGTATITVTVHDGATENSTFSRSFTVLVRSLNDPPSLSHLPNQTTSEDIPISLPLTVGDDGPTALLTLSATSSVPTLVSATNILFGGSGANRTITVKPNTNQSGTVTITMTVTDTNGAKASDSFVLTVTAANDLPTLDPISNRTVNEDAGVQTITLTGIGPGASNETQALTLAASSSNPALIPNPTISYTSGSTTATLRFTPSTNASGNAVITVTVGDGQPQNSAFSRSVSVTVAAVNDPPVISSLPALTTPEDVPITVPFTVNDAETSPFLLTVTGSSSNTNLVPNGNIFIGGAGTNRTATIIPAANGSGTTTITLRVSDGTASASNSFLFTVASVNDPPTLDPIPDVGIVAGAVTFDVGFAGVSFGPSNENQNLTVTAVSSNTTLLTVMSLNYKSGDPTGSVRLRSASSNTGAVTVAVTVNDRGFSNNIVTRAFTVFLRPSGNNPPTISSIANRTTLQSISTGPIPFVVDDLQTAPGTLSVTARSSNPVLVPNGNIVFGGSGSNRTVSITPAPNQTGSALILLTVMDSAFGIATNSFSLTVTGAATPPRLSRIADQSISEDSTNAVVLFTVEDSETPAANLAVSARSSNQALIPDSNLRLSGGGTNRALLLTPTSNQSGSANITLTVSDGTTNTSQSFLLTVLAIKHLPGISSIADQITLEDTPILGIPFAVGDIETTPENLVISASSSNPNLVSATNILFGGSTSSRNLSIFPATNQFGTANITVTVADTNGSTASQAFVLTVAAVNDPPTLDPIANLTLNQAAGAQTIPLTGITVGATNENQTLALSAISSDPTIVANPSINYTSPGSNGTLVLKPIPGARGTATISVTVNDGQPQNNLFTRTFTLTITQPPFVSELPDQTIDEDVPLAVPFNISDLDTPIENLTLSAVSSNAPLVPGTNMVFTGIGTNRTLLLAPTANSSGTTLITISATDTDGNSGQSSFRLVINPVADVPMIVAQPQSQTVTNGASLTLQVVATVGLGPLRYQWQRNGADLPGQTNSSLTFPSAQASDEGGYRVVLSAPEGTVTSATAQLRVVSSPRIIQIIRIGTTNRITFPTVAGASYTLEYKSAFSDPNWLGVTTLIGTGQSLTIEDAPRTDALLLYRLRVE